MKKNLTSTEKIFKSLNAIRWAESHAISSLPSKKINLLTEIRLSLMVKLQSLQNQKS
jgi:flagellar biosynthesis/type III secretory pathway chaperone